MNKQNSFLSIAMATTFVILMITAQGARAQVPSNITSGTTAPGVTPAVPAEAPKSVRMDIVDTRAAGGKYSYDLPIDAQLEARISNIMKGILGPELRGVTPTPGAASPTGVAPISATDQVVENVSSTVKSLYSPTGPTGFFDVVGRVVSTGMKVASTVGPLVALFGPGYGYK